MIAIYDLIQTATCVIENRESGNLADAIQQMSEILGQINTESQYEKNRYSVFGYRTDLKCPISTWVAACNVDEAKMVIAQQQPTVIVCGVVKGWVQLN